jgi:hypothetical protein
MLRVFRLDAIVGGFHAHNEANYVLIAKNFFHSSLFAPTPDGHELFLETPPLYPWILHAVFRVTGVSVLAARLVSVAASLGLVAATGLLGERLFGRTAGIAAALVVAVAPVSVLTGRNAQTDSLLVLLLVLAVRFFWEAERGGTSRRTAMWTAFSVCMGLALFTKLFALVAGAALVAWETLEHRGFSWMRDRRRWFAAAGCFVLPVAFYGYHAVVRGGDLARKLSAGAAIARSASDSLAELASMAPEAWWAVSPVLAVALLAGVLAALSARDGATRLVLILTASFAVFYFLVHKHSYYLLSLLPWPALLAGRAFGRARGRWRTPLAAATAISAVFVTLVDVTSMKSGFSEFDAFGRAAPGMKGTRHELLVTRDMWESYATLLWLADPAADLTIVEGAPADSDGRLQRLGPDEYFVQFVHPRAGKPPAGWLFGRERYGLTLFGITVAEAHPNPHFFRQGKYVIRRTGPPWQFGVPVLTTYPALAVIPLPPELALYRTPAGLSLR